MDEANWYFEREGNQIEFVIDLDPAYLKGRESTAANWLQVLVETAHWVGESGLVPHEPLELW